MPNRNFIFFISLVCCVLAGCGTSIVSKLDKGFMTPYLEPATGQLARLRSITGGTIRLIPNSACMNWSIPGAGIVNSRNFAMANDKSFNDRSLGMPTVTPQKNSSEVYVSANQDLTLAATEPQLYITISFRPEPNSDYEFKPVCDRRSCIATLSRLKTGTDGSPTIADPVPFKVATQCN